MGQKDEGCLCFVYHDRVQAFNKELLPWTDPPLVLDGWKVEIRFLYAIEFIGGEVRHAVRSYSPGGWLNNLLTADSMRESLMGELLRYALFRFAFLFL